MACERHRRGCFPSAGGWDRSTSTSRAAKAFALYTWVQFPPWRTCCSSVSFQLSASTTRLQGHAPSPRKTRDDIFCHRGHADITRDFLALESVNLSVVGLSMESWSVMLRRSRFTRGSLPLLGFFFSSLFSLSCKSATTFVLCQLVSRGSIWKLKETVWPEMRDKCSPFSISEKTSGQIFSLSCIQQLLLLYPSSLCNFPVVLIGEWILCTSIAASFEPSQKFYSFEPPQCESN